MDSSSSNSRYLRFSKGGAEAQDGDDEGGEEEEEDDTEDLDVVYEADVMQDQRLLDNDDVRVFGTKSAGLKGERLKVVNPFAFDGGSDDGWQVQNAAQLKKRLKRTIIQQLSKKDFMPDERAKMVRYWKKWKQNKENAVFSLPSFGFSKGLRSFIFMQSECAARWLTFEVVLLCLPLRFSFVCVMSAKLTFKRPALTDGKRNPLQK